MPHSQGGSSYIDLRKIVDVLVSKWPLFVITLSAFCLSAVVYLKITPKLYSVRSSIQVINQFVTDKTAGSERFISGQELMAGNPEIEDEIGILSSYSLIEKALNRLDFNISYYKYRTNLGFVGESLSKEIYGEAIRIVLDTAHLQLINTPIYISFPDPLHYRIKIDASDAVLYDFSKENAAKKNIEVIIDETLPLARPFKNELLHFSVVIDSLFDYTSPYTYFFKIHSKESLAKAYSSKLKISAISKGSNIVNLTINGTVPEKEVDFLDALGKEYIQNDLMNENQLGLKTLEFIDHQLGLIYDSLEIVERSLKSFRQANRIVDIPTSSSNYNEQLEQLEEEQAKLLVQQKYLHFTLENLKRNEEIIDIVAPTSVGLSDAFLNNLMLQLSDLNKEKISKSYSSGPNSLVSQVLAEKIENTKAALKENVNNLLNSTTISLQHNQSRINKIVSRIEELPQSERDLTSINRKFSFNDNVYNYLLEKRVEAGIALASNLPDKSIIDRARLVSNEPVSPNRTLILFGAFILGVTLPVGLIVVQQFLDIRISDPKEVESLLHVPIIGSFRRAKKKDAKKMVILHESGQLKEAFRFLIIDLKQDYNLAKNKVIGITSFEEGDGKTFSAVNMATTFAKSGLHTILIDSDIYKNEIKNYFESSNHKEGLMEYLAHEKEIKPLICPSSFRNLHYMSAGSSMNGSEKTMLNYENKLAHLFDDLKQHYDVIIVDTPAFAKKADYFLLSKFFSINLLVIRHKKTSKKNIEKIFPNLSRKNLKNLKVLYNDVPDKRA